MAQTRLLAGAYSQQAQSICINPAAPKHLNHLLLQRPRNYNYVLTEAEQRAVLPVAQQRQHSIAEGKPLTSGSGTHFRILDLTPTHRIRFMTVLPSAALHLQ